MATDNGNLDLWGTSKSQLNAPLAKTPDKASSLGLWALPNQTWKPTPVAPSQSIGAQAVNAVTSGAAGGWLMNLLGISPARLDKGVHQVLVSALGAALILFGFVMVVMNTNSAKTAGRAIVATGKKAAKAAGEAAVIA